MATKFRKGQRVKLNAYGVQTYSVFSEGEEGTIVEAPQTDARGFYDIQLDSDTVDTWPFSVEELEAA